VPRPLKYLGALKNPMSLLPLLASPTFVIEILIVFLVVRRISSSYKASHAALELTRVQLVQERSVLKNATDALAAAHLSNAAPDERARMLRDALWSGSWLQKRALLVESNRDFSLDSGLPRVAARALEQARYSTGSFTFIGLIGTLACLGISVFYLMVIVGRSGSGGASGAALSEGLRAVVGDMSRVFGGMFLAFASTAVGIRYTLKLAHQSSEIESDWDELRADLDDFTLAEIEPIAPALRRARFAADPNQLDLAPVEILVRRMESVAQEFSASLAQSAGALSNIQSATGSLRPAMEGAASMLAASAKEFGAAVAPMHSDLAKLRTAINAQNEGQKSWHASTSETLTWLRDVVSQAQNVFGPLAALHTAMSRDSEATRQEVASAVEKMVSLSSSVAEAAQGTPRAVTRTSEEIQKGLLEIKGSIDDGVRQERAMIEDLRSIIEVMSQYTAHIEDWLRQMPAALAGEPILAHESNAQALIQAVARDLGQGMSGVRQEVSGLRGDVRQSMGDGLGTLLAESQRATLGQVSAVASKVDALDTRVRTSLDGAGGASGIQGVQAQVQSLSSQVEGLSSQLRLLDSKMQRVDSSWLLRLGRR